MSNEYSEKLRDPRWQQRRLQIFSRDKWKCRACGATDKTLHVHHIFYLPQREPWDIPSGLLLTFCEDCHKDQYHQETIVHIIGKIIDQAWYCEDQFGGSDYNTILTNLYFSLKD